jgi:ABC-type bacteriocin/lantibiotic exporter with double-glycine peptidase domain
MDCGPAALKCLLEGFGLPVSYDRLREACQTDLDGSSIDTIEQVARLLGLDARQVMLPGDHLLVPEARALPALLVVLHPIGVTHFIVVWRRCGPWVQVMDPAAGRVWLSARDLRERIYLHTLPVPAAAWRQWAGSPELLDVLAARARRLRLPAEAWDHLATEALEDPGWRSLATLDASLRMVSALGRAGAVRSGRQAEALLRRSCELGWAKAPEGSGSIDATEAIPPSYWSVRPAPSAPGNLLLKGAVLIRVRGRSPAPAATRTAPSGDDRSGANSAALSRELRAAVAAPRSRPVLDLLQLLWKQGWLAPAALLGGLTVAAAGAVLETSFFRALVDLPARLGLAEQRMGAALAIVLFLALALALELSTTAEALALGRRLEIDLRLRFLRKLVTLGDRYFRSRLVSDMAERCHGAYRLRMVPEVAANFVRNAVQLVLTAAAIAWLDPEVGLLAGASAALALGLSVGAQPLLMERDLRLRNHAGALGRFYLDAMLGLVPARNHGAQAALRREHEGLLVEWVKAGRRFEGATLGLDTLQAVGGYGLAVWILFRHLSGHHGPAEMSQVLLLAYWTLFLPILGQQLDLAARQAPLLRNTALRLLEPLGAAGEVGGGEERISVPEPGTAATSPTVEAIPPVPLAGAESAGATPPAPRGVAVRLAGAAVTAAGHLLLRDIDLAVEPGTEVAIVGASGAGKSTLVGLLLGWHRLSAGRLFVDGADLDDQRLAGLRAETAWVDPAVQLWNAPLFDNLRYGASGAGAEVGKVVDVARLHQLLQDLPAGLQSVLGEGGALVSGGEGQRVRLGRALLRRDARLVILDEPFRGLDGETRSALLREARRWWRGATFFCITHDVAETLSFDRVAVIEAGSLAELGCPRELAERPGSRYRRLLAGEAEMRRRLAGDPGWRRLRLDGGRLVGDEPQRQGACHAPALL